MVIDSSAIIAILLEEPEAALFAHASGQDRVRLMSAVSALEVNLVMGGRKGPGAIREFDIVLRRAEIEIVTFNAEQFELARAAWLRYGKGRNPAALNPGDCCSYAFARASGEPLLARGHDFVKTDIQLVLQNARRSSPNPRKKSN